MIFFSPCDIPVAEAMNAWRSMGGTQFFIMVSEVAGPTTSAGLALVVLLGLFARRKYPAMAGFALAVAGANAAWILAKALVARPRPSIEYASFIEPGFAFPSGHATNAFAFGVFLAVMLGRSVPRGHARRAAMTLPLVCAALVAFGRVYLGVHYVSDVVAGAVLGSVAGYAGVLLHDLLARRFR